MPKQCLLGIFLTISRKKPTEYMKNVIKISHLKKILTPLKMEIKKNTEKKVQLTLTQYKHELSRVKKIVWLKYGLN